MPPFEAAKLLYGLVATELISLRDPGAAAVPRPAPRAPGAVATPAPPTAALPPAAAPSTSASAAPLLTRLSRLRDECTALLGPVGESVVHKHYQRARADIERGAGPEAIEEAIRQISRAAAILKGSAVGEAVLRLLQSEPD
jgi:hypothetical protein